MLDVIRRLLLKVNRKLKVFRLRPISVFLFHQVSDSFDESTMYYEDWTETQQFKNNILALKKTYCFISIEEALKRIKKDRFRFRNYAVLTSDDGWASLVNILSWLDKQDVPITLFLNPAYFDKALFREKQSEKYLSFEDVQYISDSYPNVSLGMHGWEHIKTTEFAEGEFIEFVKKSYDVLKVFSSFVPFFAYPYGLYNDSQNRQLRELGFTPVIIDNGKNIDDYCCIHRELFDGVKL